jgi:hypothetical protein
MLAEIGKFKEPAKQEPSARSNQYLAGFSQGLQARRQVWCIADKRELARRALSDQIADDDKATCNTDPDLKFSGGRDD